MLFTTTNDHEELRAAIRGFAETKVKPIAFSLDKESKFPTEIVKEMGENGWMGLPYPKEYGGAGMDYIAYAIAVEELARVDGGVGVILSFQPLGRSLLFLPHPVFPLPFVLSLAKGYHVFLRRRSTYFLTSNSYFTVRFIP